MNRHVKICLYSAILFIPMWFSSFTTWLGIWIATTFVILGWLCEIEVARKLLDTICPNVLWGSSQPTLFVALISAFMIVGGITRWILTGHLYLQAWRGSRVRMGRRYLLTTLAIIAITAILSGVVFFTEQPKSEGEHKFSNSYDIYYIMSTVFFVCFVDAVMTLHCCRVLLRCINSLSPFRPMIRVLWPRQPPANNFELRFDRRFG